MNRKMKKIATVGILMIVIGLLLAFPKEFGMVLEGAFLGGVWKWLR